jgi:hypothetical protein
VRRGEGLLSELGGRVDWLRAGIRLETDDGRRRWASGFLTAVDYERDTVRALLSVLRGLADAAVWRLVGYDRGVIAALGEGRRVRHLADTDGLAPELAVLERTPGVLADLTTCVRHGDVLAIECWEPRRWRVVEVKAGSGGRSRRGRQEVRLARFEALLNSGVWSGDGEPTLRVVECPVPVRTHYAALVALIERARLDGYAMTWLEDVLRYSTDHRRIRDRRETFPGQAPLALLPYAADITRDICMGGLDVMLTLDARALERRFGERGIEADVAQGDAAGDQFVRCRRGDKGLVVPAPVREQVLIEGWTLDCLVEVVDWTLDRISDQMSVRFDERHVWEP